MLDFLPPRNFIDFTVPARADGSLLTACEQPGDYETYVRWLADYLHEADLPLSQEQTEWLAVQVYEPEMLVFACSEEFGFAIHQLEVVESWFEEGLDYQEYRTEALAEWEARSPEIRAGFPFEEWLGVTQFTFERLREEWREERASGHTWTHADIPFRSLLNLAFKAIPDTEVRYRVADEYFRNFSENSNK